MKLGCTVCTHIVYKCTMCVYIAVIIILVTFLIYIGAQNMATRNVKKTLNQLLALIEKEGYNDSSINNPIISDVETKEPGKDLDGSGGSGGVGSGGGGVGHNGGGVGSGGGVVQNNHKVVKIIRSGECNSNGCTICCV